MPPGRPRRGVVPGRDVRGTIRLVNALQHWAVEHTRLGIPILFHEEGLHGYAAVGATSFPQAIALASSWDPALVRAVNAVTAREMRARGVSEALSPVVDVARDPRWGRIEETFGEDPYLVGEMGVAAVRGLQGEGKARAWARQGVRHAEALDRPRPAGERHQRRPGAVFGAHAARESSSRRSKRSSSAPASSAVMPSYNEIDGVPEPRQRVAAATSAARRVGLQGRGGQRLLRDRGSADAASHCRRPSKRPRGSRSSAGVDIDLPSGGAYATLTQQVRDGRVAEARIDAAVRRLLALKFRAGLFEHPYADADQAAAITNNAGSARAGAQGGAAHASFC